MDKKQCCYYDNVDIKISLGNIIINILLISYEAPRPTWGYKNHFHSGYELHFIPSGNGILKVFNNQYKIEPGTFYLTGPNVYHEQIADDKNPMSEFCINFEIKLSKSYYKKNEPEIPNEINTIFETLKNTSFWFGIDEFSSISLFENIFFEFENNLIGYYTYIKSLLTQIIINAVRCFSSNKKSSYHIPQKILNDARRRVVDDFFRNFDKNISAKELAEMIGVTQRQLSRIMQSYYSMTFKEKLNLTRLEEAKNLLISTNMPIKDIADKTGFNSLSYFVRVFNRYYNISPKEFRIKSKAEKEKT
ncbi:AraC family transcriptional regulator [Caldicellulosiruptoraceae bacterium PP1]